MIHKESKIEFTIGLDENRIPESIDWAASDSGEDPSSAEAIMLSIWDKKEKSALRIDLWTKEMKMDEMLMFYHQTLVGMANSLERSTSHPALSKELQAVAEKFRKEVGRMK